jgi:TldD protein
MEGNMPDQSLRAEAENLRPMLGEAVSIIEESAPYGAVLLTSSQGVDIFVDNRQETVAERNPMAGSVVTLFDGLTMRERSMGGFDGAAILQNARELVGIGNFAKNGKIDPGPELVSDFATEMQIDPGSLSTKEKLERVRDLNRRVNKLNSQIVNVRVSYVEAREHSIFRNRQADLSQDNQRVALMVMVIVAGEEGVRYNWKRKYASGGWEALTFSDDELQNIVDNAIKLLNAERVEPGEYSVITSPDVSGVVCHESFGHGVETDMFLKERAKASYYLDRTVGSPLVNIWDDPSIPGVFGSYHFDHEGYLAKPTQIVKDGVFERGITDLYSATVLGIPRSPNGRRQDFSRKAYARMSTTFFGRGETPVSDLFNGVEHGIYLEKFSSGMEDPKGWGIQVTCHYGLEIKKGELTGRMFAPVVITGMVPEVLQSITAVGDDLVLGGGVCGKGHKEYLPVSSGGPHLLMKARLG